MEIEQIKYDSREDTEKHINEVRRLIETVTFHLDKRGELHDVSKLVEPEKSVFDEVTPKLKALTYDSDEYKASLKGMGTALKHHYEMNRHHPEYFENGISDMNMVDLLEMLCDWLAATKRHADGDIFKSLEINKKRFNMSEEMYNLLKRTLEDILL